MIWDKITPLLLGVILFAGIFSIIPNSFGGSSTDNEGDTVELGLGIDGSDSISTANFDLQKNAYATVLGTHIPTDGTVSVGVWLFASDVSLVHPTTTISSQADLNSLIDSVNAMTPPSDGLGTATAIAINNIAVSLNSNDITSDRQIIDISTDGLANIGGSPLTASKSAVNDFGIEQVNALGIGLLPDFNFGIDSFSIIVNDFEDFGDTLETKIMLEIGCSDSCDADGDGTIDVEDNCQDIANPGQEDIDGDGLGDVCDDDDDNDTILDINDNCPINTNLTQEDSDGNGIGDACQDVDGDEVLDTEDNCPFISNPNQEDSDGNGIGDACQDQELLVDATFPPGDIISVDLPEDPTTGVFSLSLELPETEGGDVVVEITDAGDTDADFSFLGSIIDFTAPCTNDCEISFTFTQDLLDEQGLTLDEVTIFHDMNHNGSFENDEAIPTVVTDNGDGTFTATATASFTSKFSVGGIKALALGALAGSGGFKGGSPPTLENLSFDGVRTVNEDGTIGFGGLIIDEILSVNNFPTQTIETGVPFELRLPFYEDNGVSAIEHVAVYVLHEDDETVYDSDLYLIYDRFKPLQTFDSNGYISDFSVDIIEKSSREIDMIFGMTFVLPMEQSDVLVRSWDKYKRSTDYKFNQLIKVVESNSKNNLPTDTSLEQLPSWDKSIESSMTKSTTIFKENFDDSHITFDMENGQSVTKHNDIPIWIKNNANWWSKEKIADDDFIAGIEYLVDQNIVVVPERHVVSILETPTSIEIPNWVKSNAGWWAEGLVSDDEFVLAIEWLIEEGIMTV